jgi:hypothetical protein
MGHGAGKEHRGKRRHPNRGRSCLHTVCGGGQTAQDVVRMTNMDGEWDLSAPGGQQLAHMHPFRGGCLLGELRQESRGVAAERVDVWLFIDLSNHEIELLQCLRISIEQLEGRYRRQDLAMH